VILPRHDLHTLTGAYALDALDTSERDRYVRHLHRCHSCPGEIRGLREVATSLALAATREPPPGMRARVLAAAARTRQLPPITDRHASPARRATAVWWPRLAVVVAAVAVSAAVLLGVAQIATQHRLDRTQEQSDAIAAILAAPDARLLTRPTSAGGFATIVVSASRRQLIVTTTGLRGLPSSKVYELWLIGPPGTRPAGLLSEGPGGRSRPVLASGLSPGDQLGLTIEPAGGTSKPTTTPVLILPLPG
jgi:Anti-sigma-K factor rskA